MTLFQASFCYKLKTCTLFSRLLRSMLRSDAYKKANSRVLPIFYLLHK